MTGADINAREKIHGESALHHACANGNMDLLLFLCERDIELEQEDYYQATALFSAVANGHLDIVNELIVPHLIQKRIGKAKHHDVLYKLFS